MLGTKTVNKKAAIFLKKLLTKHWVSHIITFVGCDEHRSRNLRGVAQSGSAPALGAGRRGFKSLHPDHLWQVKGEKDDTMALWSSGLRHRPFTAVTRVRIPAGSSFPSFSSSGFGTPRAISSVGQSSRLITDRSGVQVPEGPPLWPGSSVGLECQPVTLEVEGSSPFRVAFLSHLGDAGVAQLAEQLICNQQVAGSSPFTSSFPWFAWGMNLQNLFVGRFPSGQREQTVNLPSQTSVVRIHPCPPTKCGNGGIGRRA